MHTKKSKQFTQLLMLWHKQENKRVMPWKGIKDPYKIWLSEIILQQTRVEQGWAYYEKFIQHFPTIQHLAKANDEQVFKLWEGLGYYNRCKNLLFTARQIVQEQNGVFPTTYEALLALKGIGPYTAAAIASFAFNLPFAVVDGNVFRVLARYFGESTPTDSTKGKQLFTQIAASVLDENEPGLFNQAIMDFGATVCKPALPQCGKCVLNKHCEAYGNAIVNKLPVKEKVLTKKTRWISYFLFYHNNHVLVNKRAGNDIWQNLFEFNAVENEEALIWTAPLVQEWLNEQFAIKKASIQLITALTSQQLTHQKIKGQFIKIELNNVPLMLQKYQWQPVQQLSQLAFPKFINQFLEQKEIQTNLF